MTWHDVTWRERTWHDVSWDSVVLITADPTRLCISLTSMNPTKIVFCGIIPHRISTYLRPQLATCEEHRSTPVWIYFFFFCCKNDHNAEMQRIPQALTYVFRYKRPSFVSLRKRFWRWRRYLIDVLLWQLTAIQLLSNGPFPFLYCWRHLMMSLQ